MENVTPRKLYRSSSNTVIAGVCGGLGAYFGVDPVIWRIGWALVTVATLGTGLLAYVVFWIFVPREGSA